MSDTIGQQSIGIYIGPARRCQIDEDTNCFEATSGKCSVDNGWSLPEERQPVNCSSMGQLPVGSTEWTFTMFFIGTGIDITGHFECQSDSDNACGWTQEDAELTLGWKLDGVRVPANATENPTENAISARQPSALAATQSITHLISIRGSTPSKHTLSLSSTDAPEGLRLLAGHAVTLADSDTPVGPLDAIWVPARHESFKYDRPWDDVDEPVPGGRASLAVGASAEMEFFGDAFQLHTQIVPGPSSGTVRTQFSANGIPGSSSNENMAIGRYSVKVTIEGVADGGRLAVEGLWFHPGPNVTRIGDALGGSGQSVVSSSSVVESESTSGHSPAGTDGGESGTTDSEVNPSDDSESSASKGGTNTAGVIGGVVGGVVVLLGILIAVLMVVRRRQRRRAESNSSSMSEPVVNEATPFTKTYHPPQASEFGDESRQPLDASPIDSDASSGGVTSTATASGSARRRRDSDAMMQMLHNINERIDGLVRPPQYSA